MSNEAFAQGLCSVWFAETFIENGVPNAAQSSRGTAKVASAVEVGIAAEAEAEGGTNEADVGGRDIDGGLLNKIRGLTVSEPLQKKKSPSTPHFYLFATVKRRINGHTSLTQPLFLL